MRPCSMSTFRGQTSYDLAEKLHEKGVPILFLTGYATFGLAGKWNKFPNCFKPCVPAELKALLIKALTRGRDRRS